MSQRALGSQAAARTEYRPAKGSLITRAQAHRFGPVIERLMRRHGAVSPERVLDEARKPTSPLHAYFEWDDAVAAERHRLNQARYLLRSLIIVPVVKGQSKRPIRAFFAVNVDDPGSPRGSSYVRVDRIIQQKELRMQIVASALREAESWWARFHQYEELAEIGAAIRRTLKLLDKDSAA